MRSVFSAGMLDGFQHAGFNPFDVYIGVSAGASNLAAYLHGQPGLSLQLFLSLSRDTQFLTYRRFLKGGGLMDLDRLFQLIEDAGLDLSGIFHHRKTLLIGVTDLHTGEASYIDAQAGNILDAMRGTMALPLIYAGFPMVEGRCVTDGGVACAIPVQEAIRRGAKRVMVIRSRHRDYDKKDTLVHKWIRWKLREHPALVATMQKRVERHRQVLALIRNPPNGVVIHEVCCPEAFNVGRFERDSRQLLRGYELGLAQSVQAIADWQANE